MSYILDALKRADAERQRGTVPGLHARQVTPSALPAASGAQNRLWLAAGAALTLGGIAAGLWIWRAPAGDARPAAADVASASPAAPQPSAQPVPAPTPTPAPTARPAAEPAAQQRRAAVPPPPSAAPIISKPAPPKPKPKADTVVAKAAMQGASAPGLRTPAPAAKAPARRTASADVPLLGELSEDVRRQIPPLTINGVVYSENPGQRVLLVNQQVLTQGALAAPEVNLEEIRARSSVFSFRGTRFRVAH